MYIEHRGGLFSFRGTLETSEGRSGVASPDSEAMAKCGRQGLPGERLQSEGRAKDRLPSVPTPGDGCGVGSLGDDRAGALGVSQAQRLEGRRRQDWVEGEAEQGCAFHRS